MSTSPAPGPGAGPGGLPLDAAGAARGARTPVARAGDAAVSGPATPAPAGRRWAARGPAADRLAARVLGTALVVAACDPARAFHGPGIGAAAVVAAAAAAWWAAPMNDARPARTSMRWYRIAELRSNTVLAAAAVVLAAATGPGPWTAACTAALLVAYLLTTDQWTRGATAPRRERSAGPATAASAATAVVFLAARIPVGGTAWSRLPAVLAVAVAASCLGLALLRGRGPRR